MFFFFNDTATTEIYTLSLHDALPILVVPSQAVMTGQQGTYVFVLNQDGTARSQPVTVEHPAARPGRSPRSEEHTSELQSRLHLVCRLLLEKKKETRKEICGRRTDLVP